MGAKRLTCFVTGLIVLLAGQLLAEDPVEDPFDGGFAVNQDVEIFTLGTLHDSLQGSGFDWLTDQDSIVKIASGCFPESYQCGDDRDIAAADFDGDFLDELAVAWNRDDGGVFVGLPTLNAVTLQIDPGGWHVPASPVPSGALYATSGLADVLGEIRVVPGNFYADPAMEFVLAYLSADSNVHLSVFDVDSATLIPVEKGSLSDQAVNTEVSLMQQKHRMSRLDVATGDLDGDGLDEIVLIVNDPDQSPASDVMVDIYDYDTLAHAITPVSKLAYTANSDPDHTCLRRLAVEAGNFDSDARQEIAIMHRWSNPVSDDYRVGGLHALKLDSGMTAITDAVTDPSPAVPRWPDMGEYVGFNEPVYPVNVYDGKLIAGGQFTLAGQADANKVAAWDGTSWSTLGSGMTNDVYALTVYDNELIAGGAFGYAGGEHVYYIAAWDGAAWGSLGSGMTNYVYALNVYDNQLIAGGAFGYAGGEHVYYIAAWDGTSWSTLGSGMTNEVYALTVYDNELIAGGAFGYAGGEHVYYIAAWDGSQWHDLGGGMNGQVRALAVYNGDLIAAGDFTYAGLAGDNVNARRIARWDGTHWHTLGEGLSAPAHALAVYGNDLIAGGEFVQVEPSTTVDQIARWDGSTWYAMGSGMSWTVRGLTAYDSKLIAAGSFQYAGGKDVNNIAAWDGSDWFPLLPSMELPMDMTVTNIDGNGPRDSIATDELFITACRENSGNAEQYIRVYRFDSTSSIPSMCTPFDTTLVDSVLPESPQTGLYTSRRSMAVDDVTGGGTADMTMLFSNNSDTTRIGVLELYPNVLSPCHLDSVISRGQWATDENIMSELVLADLDTTTVVLLGQPAIFHVDSVVQPLAIINAPPVHYDILGSDTFDVSQRYPLGSQAPEYETRVDYYNSEGFSATTESEMRRDWGVSASLEAWKEGGGFDFRTYMETNYGDHFSKKSGTTETIKVGSNIYATTDDRMYYVRLSYDLLEYSVVRAGDTVGHLMVTTPSKTETGWSPVKSIEEMIPNHEVENILSYPKAGDPALVEQNIENNPLKVPGVGVIGDAYTFFTMEPAGASQWFLGMSKFTESSVSEEHDFSMGFDFHAGISYDVEVGFSLFGLISVSSKINYGVRTGLNSTYGGSEISTFSSSFSEKDSLHVTLGWIDSGPAGCLSENRQYEVTPYAYWANNGALVIDYAVTPIVCGEGDDPTWWQIHYSDPDPALILPWRLDNEKYEASEPEESRYQTKEILFVPSRPSPGDSVGIGVRVHNFSLAYTPDSVAVSFYLGDPDKGGVILTDMYTGDSVFYVSDTLGTPIPIEPQGSGLAMMTWQVPNVGSISGCQRIWAVIDPADDISPEVHDNGDWATNNKGWKLLRVDTDNICIDSDGDGYGDPAFRCHTCPGLDNCPTVYNDDQADANGDGIGDACQGCCGIYTDGVTGNANCSDDGKLTLSDISRMIDFLYISKAALCCYASGNTNGSWDDGDCKITLSDISKLIDALYISKQPTADCMPECER